VNTQTEHEPRIYISPEAAQAWRVFEKEIATYLREFPRLLAEGHAGRHVLIRGDEILGIWDIRADAVQAGRNRFGLQPIYVQTIGKQDAERFALVKKQLPDFPG
jgi:hypothetical protein